MSDVLLGNQPAQLTVFVTDGDAFAAELVKADATDWDDGTVASLVLGETSFDATVDGSLLSWSIQAADWAEAINGDLTPASLAFGAGLSKVTVATGFVITNPTNGAGFGSAASFSAPGVPSVLVQPVSGPSGPGVAAGGTSGQVLAKASGTDFDTRWESLGTAAGHAATDFDTAGAAAAAQTAATTAAATDATSKVAAEATARAAAITSAVAALVNGAPGALDTLNELAAALGDDANFATTITNAVAAKAPLASPALTGAPTINGTPLAAILVVDNGDGTATVTTQGGLTIVDNGDGTSTITLAGASVTVGNGASVASVNGKTGTVVLAASDVGADASGVAAAAQAAAAIDATSKVATETARASAAEALLIPLTQKGAASGVATLDSGGKIPAGQIPPLAFNQVFPAASQAAMLALAANPGDVAVRSDTSSTFMLSAAPASTLGNWTLISIDAAPVSSVAGRTGAVTLAVADVTGAAPLASPALTGAPTAPTPTALDASTKVATTAYADAAVGVEKARAIAAEALALQLAGGTMSGAIAMGSNAITGVSDLAVSGLTGAASAARFVGATTSGPPVSGSFSAGDYVVDKSGAMWACVTAGSPGVWAQVGGSPLASGTQDMLGWTYDPATNLTTRILPSAATLILCRIALRQKVTVTNVHYVFPTVGNTLTNSFVALFKSDGTIIGQSADMSTAWGSGGSTNGFATPLAGGPFAVTPLGSNDFVWAAFYVGTATTLPSFGGGVTANSQAINLGTTTARSRYATIAQANTATLASFAPASIAKAGTAFYMGVS